MAEVSLVMACSHSPFLYTRPEQWNETRARRQLRADVPFETVEECVAKFNRCMRAFDTLKERVQEAQPDVMVIFGDDQNELFHFDNFPAFAVYLGAEFEGHRTVVRGPGGERAERGAARDPSSWVKVKGHPDLAKQLMEGLIEREFDLAFSIENPEPDRGMGHAFMRPGHYITPEYHIPMVPFFVNAYFAPQPRAMRCVQLGRAVKEVIEQSPLDLKVAVLGSGGLWHTPGGKNAYLDEEFDQTILNSLQAGDAEGMAGFFDSQARPGEIGDGADARGLDGGTKMRGGVGGGTGEWRGWMAAAGVADALGLTGRVVDYVPVYASPCAMGFAYWE